MDLLFFICFTPFALVIAIGVYWVLKSNSDNRKKAEEIIKRSKLIFKIDLFSQPPGIKRSETITINENTEYLTFEEKTSTEVETSISGFLNVSSIAEMFTREMIQLGQELKRINMEADTKTDIDIKKFENLFMLKLTFINKDTGEKHFRYLPRTRHSYFEEIRSGSSSKLTLPKLNPFKERRVERSNSLVAWDISEVLDPGTYEVKLESTMFDPQKIGSVDPKKATYKLNLYLD